MIRALRFTLAALLLAAPALLSLTPRTAHAFCITCDDVPVYEYVNEITGHYLLLPAYDPEVAVVEGGGAGPGWERTGNDFTTLTYAPLPVCRFYSPVFNTHFYTADATECAIVKQNPDWVYEKSPFSAYPADGGSCEAPWFPAYRFYHAGDHRFTADPVVRDEMRARGWTDEGVGFCVERGGREAVQTLQTVLERIDSVQGCMSSAGGCAAVDSLPALSNRVPPYLPPSYFDPNPAYPSGVGTAVGYAYNSTDLFTNQPADPYAILEHSFATQTGELFIKGQDRTGGNYAGISPMLELPGVAGSDGDQRLFVWGTVADRELRLSAYAYIGVVARDGPGSHAYGGPLLEFGDAKSGHSFLVTIQAYGTVAPGDFVAPDARTGQPIISTVFRPDPMFGRALSGSFIPCSGDGTVCAPYVSGTSPVAFTFSLKRADFQSALARARAVDPALSDNPADYFLGRLAFHNETYLDARLGATIFDLTAQVWYVE